jgi:SRSO17 transposase
MSLLDKPEAQVLLNDANFTADAVRGCADRLTGFLQRYLPHFYRVEQRDNATLVIRGLISGLERKTCEPIASAAQLPRKPIQFFVGSGKWDDESVMTELRLHVREELAQPDGVVVLDPSSFPKKGTHSCGVARQWCGRLGKVESCQVGVFLVYAATTGYAPLDRQLYLPEEWARDKARRTECHVPSEVKFQEKWHIALDLLDRSLPDLPHGWIAGDDEFGRVSAFRAKLRLRKERYILDVPCNTLVRDLQKRRPPRKQAGVGRKREVPFQRADAWAKSQPASRWERLTVRDAEKGPLEVEAMAVPVRAKQEGRIGPEERLVVMRNVGESQIDYALSNASPEVPLIEVVRAQRQRHRIEEFFGVGKGDAGLGHYEVRSWVGWHHHMTLALVAMLFLSAERRRVGGENPGGDGAAGASDLHPVAPVSGTDPRGNCGRRHAGATAERRIADLPLAQGHGELPATPITPEHKLRV